LRVDTARRLNPLQWLTLALALPPPSNVRTEGEAPSIAPTAKLRQATETLAAAPFGPTIPSVRSVSQGDSGVPSVAAARLVEKGELAAVAVGTVPTNSIPYTSDPHLSPNRRRL
jgi:hypothetical protein